MITIRLLNLRAVQQRVGLSRSQIYALKAQGRFPQPVKVGPRGVRWIEQEIQDWITTRPRTGSDRPVG